MKKKVLVATGLATLLAVGLYASSNCDKGKHGWSNHGGFHKAYKHQRKHRGELMSTFKKLNLTKEQKKQIWQIKKDMMKNCPSINMAFTKDSFDKAKFIEIMKQKRDSKITNRAEFIEKVYNVLTKKQKEQFKTLLDLQDEKRALMMDKGMGCDKDCNGGR